MRALARLDSVAAGRRLSHRLMVLLQAGRDQCKISGEVSICMLCGPGVEYRGGHGNLALPAGRAASSLKRRWRRCAD